MSHLKLPRITALMGILCIITFAHSQKEVNGKVVAGDSVRIIVNAITPDEFPKIDVLFKAEDLKGYPYWGVEQSDLSVYEDEKECTVVRLRHFGEQVPINIVLVLDHSGSMSVDATLLYETNYDLYEKYYVEAEAKGLGIYELLESKESITFPLRDAKRAIKSFIPNFNYEKDNVGLIGFNHESDIVIAPGNDPSALNSALAGIEADGGTAFYDAVYQAVKQLESHEGINVVIALTDGADGSSDKQPKDIIRYAKKQDVAVYCVGLGSVEEKHLKRIADKTSGFYAHTNSSSSLDSVYTILERKIKAYYLLTYTSDNWSSTDSERDFTLKFEVEDVFVDEEGESFDLPKEVVAELKDRENEPLITYSLIGGGVLLASLLAFGVVRFVRKRKKKIIIERLSPNPGNGQFTVLMKLPEPLTEAALFVHSYDGREVLKIDVVNGENRIDISSESRAFYQITVQHPEAKPDTRKYLKR